MNTTSTGKFIAATTPAARRRMGPALVLITGCLAALVAHIVFGLAGVSALSSAQPDPGNFTTPGERYAVTSHAIALQDLAVVEDGNPPFAGPGAANQHFTLQATPVSPDQPIFIGVAPQADVSRYLDGVAYSEVTQAGSGPFRPQYREIAGPNQPAPPGDQPFWTVSAQGSGPQKIEGDLRSGSWAVVVMNADGRAGVAVDVQAELDVNPSWFGTTAVGLLVAGFVLWVIGAALILAAAVNLLRRGG